MHILIILGFIFIVIYSCLSWLLPALLAWLFKRKFHIKLKIGRIAVLKLLLKDVTLSKDGYTMHLKEVSFKSSFFNSEINKLVSVIVKELTITNYVEEKRSAVVETILKPLLSKQNSNHSKDSMQKDQDIVNLNNKINESFRTLGHNRNLDFRDTKLPPSLIMFAQFMGLHIYKASLSFHHNPTGSPYYIHFSACELHADGAAGGPARALVFSANLVGASVKMALRERDVCLVEMGCSLLVEGTVKANGPLNVEKIHASISNPTLVVQDELYFFMEKQKRYQQPRVSTLRRDTSDEGSNVVERLSPVIPKIFSLKIDATSLNCIDNSIKTQFKFSLQSLAVNSRFSANSIDSDGAKVSCLPQVYVAFQMDQFEIATNTEKLLCLNKVKLDAKLEKGVLNLYLILSILNITYNHKEAIKWYSTIAPLSKKSEPMQINTVPKKQSAAYLGIVSVSGCCEVRGAKLQVWPSRLSLGWHALKLKLDRALQDSDAEESSCACGWEVLCDGLWGRCGGGGEEATPRRLHAPRSALAALALLKCTTRPGREHMIEAMLDCLRFEWSKEIAEATIEFIDAINEYKQYSKANTIEPKIDPAESIPLNLSLNIALSHINVFLIVKETMCLMTRIDAITLEKNQNKFSAVISGLKIVEMQAYNGPVPCLRTDDIIDNFFYVKLAKIEHVVSKDHTYLDLQFLETFELHWCANLHLKILTFVREVKSFKERLKDKIKSGKSVEDSKVPLDWRLSFKNDISIGLILSEENNMMFGTDDLTIAYDHELGLSIHWHRIMMILNGDEIANVDGFSMERAIDDHEVKVERNAVEGLALSSNKVWDINVDSIRVIFPYKHRFAEAVQGDFVSLFKWIKIIHDIQKKPFTVDSPLPSDLHIKIEEVVMEMSDDPFEVKLRDNYELLEDEYKESQKRRTMLDAKVQELCKPHLFLPAGKVEELYAALRQKDVQIYVQRSRAAPPPRTRLVACCLSKLRIIALADTTMHGMENVVNRMKDIDCDSPWPEEGVELTTAWCRAVSLRSAGLSLQLRDFPLPLLHMRRLRVWGALLGAEERAKHRAVRTVVVDQGAHWGPCELERSMMPLKWYYDLCCEMAEMSYAFGPCWEPVIAQCNLAFDQVSRPSLDPSPPLAWWDKVRLLMHGRLTANFRKLTCLLHVSLDPYNTTEEMEVTWTDLVLDWTNGKIGFLGSLDVFVRTASKYDDCRVAHARLRLGARLAWRCGGDARDHRAVAPTAPTRLPEYSSHQEHDSYRAFRSQGLDLHLSMDTKPSETDGPVVLLYGSTLRWFESLKLILSGVTRPTRRGRVFGELRSRKPQLSRHYRAVSVSLTLHHLQVFYWSSSSMQRGTELLGGRVTLGSKYSLSLVPSNDGLVRRPKVNWNTLYMNCDLNDAEIWLKTASANTQDGNSSDASSGPTMEKCYAVSVRRVSYVRETTHRLTVHDLRGAWTKLNRDLAFALIDTYIKSQQLKKNLSTKALKEDEKVDSEFQRESDVASPPPSAGAAGVGSSGGAMGGAMGMLAALVAGSGGGAAPCVFSEELGGATSSAEHHADLDQGTVQCLIELVNSQVVLKGCETSGYVILCAARAEVRQKVRRSPPGFSWEGHLDNMQYYATLNSREQTDENIQWVSVEEIGSRGGWAVTALPDVPRLVGSGLGAGAVIGRTVGPPCEPLQPPQLQRIVSRCACEFYYVRQEGAEGLGATPDTFTLVHHDLDVCTNSLQYAMLLDVVNNVVLHVEPGRRRTLERRARMRFQLQLRQEQQPRRLIQQLQTQVRESLARLRRLEKEYYLKNRSMSGHDPQALEELKMLDDQVNECKETVWSLGEELDAMVRAWREAGPAGGAARQPSASPHRHNEICFKSARWRLTDADGQLGIADLWLTNFLYTKTSRSDDSVEHQLELGYVRVTNLLPNEPFPEVLVPQAAPCRAPLARRAALRVFCRDRPPVGGISVKEHFEVNIVPIRIGLTKKFFNTMLKFCFPERDPDTIEAMEGEEEEGTLRAGSSTTSLVSAGSKKLKKKSKDSNSNFYVKRDKKDKDDVEKMKERAEKNKLFIYIKIPEVPVRVSYKGSKEKNLEDVRDLPLVLPTLEYHNVTWTWLDLLLATKTDTRRVILSQAIRQKLQLHRRAAAAPEPLEEDKARLLLGDRTVTENKPHKKTTPSVFKFSKS